MGSWMVCWLAGDQEEEVESWEEGGEILRRCSWLGGSGGRRGRGGVAIVGDPHGVDNNNRTEGCYRSLILEGDLLGVVNGRIGDVWLLI